MDSSLASWPAFSRIKAASLWSAAALTAAEVLLQAGKAASAASTAALISSTLTSETLAMSSSVAGLMRGKYVLAVDEMFSLLNFGDHDACSGAVLVVSYIQVCEDCCK
jgi:hypothetical protein